MKSVIEKKLDVCIPTLNSAKTLDQCLRTIKSVIPRKRIIICGGYSLPETTIDKVTGIIVHGNYEKNLIRIIRNFNNYRFSVDRCIRHAKKFNTKNFLKKFKRIIQQLKRVET